MNGADIEIERAGRARIGGVAGREPDAVDRKSLDMKRPPCRGIDQVDVDAGDRIGIAEGHRKALVAGRIGRRLEFEQSGHRLAVDQNLRLRADAADYRAITGQRDGRRRQPSGDSGAADNDVVSGSAMDDVVTGTGVDEVTTAAEIDDVGDSRSGNSEAGHEALAVEV